MPGVVFEGIRVTAAGIVSRRDAALALGLTPKTLCDWSAKGIGPLPIRIGGRIFYRWDDVAAFAAGPNDPRK